MMNDDGQIRSTAGIDKSGEFYPYWRASARFGVVDGGKYLGTVKTSQRGLEPEIVCAEPFIGVETVKAPEIGKEAEYLAELEFVIGMSKARIESFNPAQRAYAARSYPFLLAYRDLIREGASDDWSSCGDDPVVDMVDKATIGRELIERIADCRYPGSPLENWHPADSPVEVVVDLVNMIADLKAEAMPQPEPVVEILTVARPDLMAAVDKRTTFLRAIIDGGDRGGTSQMINQDYEDTANLLERLAAYMKGQDERIIRAGNEIDRLKQFEDAFTAQLESLDWIQEAFTGGKLPREVNGLGLSRGETARRWVELLQREVVGLTNDVKQAEDAFELCNRHLQREQSARVGSYFPDQAEKAAALYAEIAVSVPPAQAVARIAEALGMRAA